MGEPRNAVFIKTGEEFETNEFIDGKEYMEKNKLWTITKPRAK